MEGWKNHRKPTEERAAALRQRLLDNEPRQLESVLEFAERAWRRPLVDVEKEKLRALYHVFRGRKLEHDTALRITLARVLVAPGFLYRTEQPASGNEAAPVTDLELATRLSYFLWSSLPDAELRRIAGAGELRDPENLAAQTKRLLSDDRVRRLAIQFGCQWLGVRGFDQLDEKSERHFPDFKDLRGSMYEDRSVDDDRPASLELNDGVVFEFTRSEVDVDRVRNMGFLVELGRSWIDPGDLRVLREDPAAALRRQIDGLGRTDRLEIPVAGLLGAAEAEGCSQQRDEEEEASHG